jgi:O-succinylbenzoic acid--CoA ligase
LLEQKQAFTLREVLLGGATIPVALTQQAKAVGLVCWCGYGLTELASTVCTKLADGLSDVGTVLPGHQLKIVAGEIWLRSATLARGYWRNGELVSICNAEGWFPTRDCGVLKSHRLQIIGRSDNLFFSGGEGVQPEVVEQVIARHPSIEQVFIVPVADVEFGQRPVAIVAARGEINFQDIHLWLEDKLPRFQIPVHWYTLPEQFKQEGIKVSRQKLMLWVARTPLLS